MTRPLDKFLRLFLRHLPLRLLGVFSTSAISGSRQLRQSSLFCYCASQHSTLPLCRPNQRHQLSRTEAFSGFAPNGGLMVVIEGLTASQLQLRSPCDVKSGRSSHCGLWLTSKRFSYAFAGHRP